MVCRYVHIQSDLMNISVRQNMAFFMTVASNYCINQGFVGISFIVKLMQLLCSGGQVERYKAKF